MSLKAPVVFLIFNRPELTQKVFQVIRQMAPQKLFIVADGARNDREVAVCESTRALVASIDWDCQVERNYAAENLGCRQRVSSGLNWVFEQTERAIILEDDCLPNTAFFRFCDELLERYHDQERVMAINGNNHQRGREISPYSYYFSKYFHCWGWATWRRAWQYYDVTMKLWPEFRDGGYVSWVSDSEYEQRYWLMKFEQMYQGKIDTWDYPFMFACLSQSGLVATPRVNLVANLGFGVNATHTHNPRSVFANMPTGELGGMQHPPFIGRSLVADQFVFDQVFDGAKLRQRDTLWGRFAQLKHRLGRLVKS
ncbi:Methyltransferase FkbM [Gloeomargarita lithophora Alchichica-D10]|uniref:Methyltransferase FkbM n=1 Tax=Gloeomargarita lithophora Alchichica-D10 TaxID=1188229 RepID=A0A1J0AH76_9CYAN|nr:hemolytic protein HlpA-like protein [Gloeomargarita lithophora]APB35297.1 Methyltransferase FkbM [Gloeomargarita lithophora Alchichica-D10]